MRQQDRLKEARKQVRIVLTELGNAADCDIDIPEDAYDELHEAEVCLDTSIHLLNDWTGE